MVNSSKHAWSTGWLQLDSKSVPFIQRQSDRLLPVEYLLREHLIASCDEFHLRSFYIPISNDDIDIFHTLMRPSSSIPLILTLHSSLVTLDHLLFRLKRLFFVRFLSSPSELDSIDYQQVMSLNGGLVTVNSGQNGTQHRIPFVHINKQKFIPQLDQLFCSFKSPFHLASKYQSEYLRLMFLYDGLSSNEPSNELNNVLAAQILSLVPVQCCYDERFITTISFHDFHYHEYQRRSQQRKNLVPSNDQSSLSTGWWQPPMSSKETRSLTHFKLQRPILF